MRNIKQNTAYNLMVLLVDSSDHVTGKTGATLTTTISKNGSAFTSISPTITERGNGWYNIGLFSTHTDVLGDLALHITATGADPIDTIAVVTAGSLDADISSIPTDVWEQDITSMDTASTIGEYINNEVLSISKYIALT